MRLASLEDISRAYERAASSSARTFHRLEVAGLSGFTDFDIQIDQPLVAVCGATGIGKSTILEMVRLIGQENSSEVYGDGIARFDGAKAKIHINKNDETTEFPLELEEHNEACFDCDLIDLDSRTSTIQHLFRSVDVESLSEGIELSTFDAKLMELCAFICGKSYEKICVREIEIEDRIFPLFQISLPHRQYDSRTCSHGELSILYLAWALFYSDPKVFLIEEPESFLPPVAQGRVFYLLASAIVRHGHLIMFSTHAADLIVNLPPDALLPVKSVGQNSKVLKDATARQRILRKLGLQPKRLCVIYVEDELAKIVTIELLNRSDLTAICRIEVQAHTESSGGIKKFVDGLDQAFSTLCMIGLLDGDMRQAASKWKNKERFKFLPFKKAMEAEFLEAIHADLNSFASSVGRSVEQIEDCLDAATGGNIHERFQKAAATLGLPVETFGIYACGLWLNEPNNTELADKFLSDLKEQIMSLPSH